MTESLTPQQQNIETQQDISRISESNLYSHESTHGHSTRSALGRTALAVTLIASSLVGVGGEAFASHQPAHHAAVAVSNIEGPIAPTLTQVTESFTVGDSEVYAPNFTASIQAGELTNSSSPSINAEYIANQVRGGVVESISVQGSASAEDAGPNAGVTTPSVQNIQLATERASVFEPQLQTALVEAGVSIPEIQTASPIEDSWSPEEVSQATELASQFGYTDYAQMIEAYNVDSSKVPPDVDSFLNQTLQTHRNVRVVVVVDKQQQSHVISIPKQENSQERHNPIPVHHANRTTINSTEGYIPEDSYVGGASSGMVFTNRANRRHPNGTTNPPINIGTPTPYPPREKMNRRQKDAAPVKTINETPAANQKQPLPDSYNPNSSRRAGNKNHSMGRTGRGRKA